jgi:hypothetical protein
MGTSLRIGRAAVFAAVCVALSAFGHSMMAPMPIPPWSLAMALIAVFEVSWVLAGKERGLAAITALTLGTQAVLHFWFALSQGTGADGSACAPGMGTGSGMSAMAAMPAAGGQCMQSTSMAHMTSGMLLAHGLAGLVSAWWLRRGEAAAFGLMRRVSARALGFLHLPAVAAAVAPAVSRITLSDDVSREPRPSRVLLKFQVIRRGPPFRPLATVSAR